MLSMRDSKSSSKRVPVFFGTASLLDGQTHLSLGQTVVHLELLLFFELNTENGVTASLIASVLTWRIWRRSEVLA